MDTQGIMAIVNTQLSHNA